MTTNFETDRRALPDTLADFLGRIAVHSADRERQGERLFAEMQVVRDLRLGGLRIPRALGGTDLSTHEFFEFLIELGAADPNLGQALRAHYAYVEGLLLDPPSVRRDALLERLAGGEIVGNAISEISTAPAGVARLGTVFEVDGDGYAINGTKYYSTGTLYSDLIWVRGVTTDGRDAMALVPTDDEGVEVVDDWDGFGQRLTGTGTTHFRAVRVDADDVKILERVASGPRRPDIAYTQLFLQALIAGILAAVGREAVDLLGSRKRGFTHGFAELPREDPVLLGVVGEIASDAMAARAIVLAAADAVDAAFADFRAGRHEDGSAEAASLQAAAAKVVVDRLGQRSATLLFEAGGASATRSTANLDRHWRNIRTIASHNTTALKSAVIGDHLVNETPLPDNTYF
ncbi:MAG: acyl-CoA dehydrogenase family protein [Actinobacteria bacterium]|nr:acyl-CoA dehydrogenase family protein [Actinomycetota bacterium]